MSAGRRPWFRWGPVSDEEFIEQVRRSVELQRRWRWALIALRGGLAVVFIGVLLTFANQGANLARVFENQWIILSGFGVGLLLGLALGMIAHKVARDLIALLPSLRMEKLLLRYHDTLLELSREDPESTEDPRAIV